jgi:hypothetical protein
VIVGRIKWISHEMDAAATWATGQEWFTYDAFIVVICPSPS